mgnify:FL=1
MVSLARTLSFVAVCGYFAMRWLMSAITAWVCTGNSTRADDLLLARQLLYLLQTAARQRGPAWHRNYESSCLQIQAIGDALCAQGGADRMREIAALVEYLGGNMRELDAHWDAICDWHS